MSSKKCLLIYGQSLDIINNTFQKFVNYLEKKNDYNIDIYVVSFDKNNDIKNYLKDELKQNIKKINYYEKNINIWQLKHFFFRNFELNRYDICYNLSSDINKKFHIKELKKDFLDLESKKKVNLLKTTENLDLFYFGNPRLIERMLITFGYNYNTFLKYHSLPNDINLLLKKFSINAR
jgi:hypothetical protein